MNPPRPILQLLEPPPSPQVRSANRKPAGDKELSRLDRDTLLNSINRRRAAIPVECHFRALARKRKQLVSGIPPARSITSAA